MTSRPSHTSLLSFCAHSRRYRSAAESSSAPSLGGFDRNAITTGTDFMQWLSRSVSLFPPTLSCSMHIYRPAPPPSIQLFLFPQLRRWIEGKKRPVANGGDPAWQNIRRVSLPSLAHLTTHSVAFQCGAERQLCTWRRGAQNHGLHSLPTGEVSHHLLLFSNFHRSFLSFRLKLHTTPTLGTVSLGKMATF